MRKALIIGLILSIFVISGCGVRIPDDFEYTLRRAADANEKMLKKIDTLPEARRIEELKLMVETDIKDFRNAANTVEKGR